MHGSGWKEDYLHKTLVDRLNKDRLSAYWSNPYAKLHRIGKEKSTTSTDDLDLAVARQLRKLKNDRYNSGELHHRRERQVADNHARIHAYGGTPVPEAADWVGDNKKYEESWKRAKRRHIEATETESEGRTEPE